MLRRFSLLKWPGGGYSIYIDRIQQMLHTTVLLQENVAHRAHRDMQHSRKEKEIFFLFAHYLASSLAGTIQMEANVNFLWPLHTMKPRSVESEFCVRRAASQ